MIAQFGSCEVDLDRLEIRADGEVVAVEPQVFDVLSYLIDHRERMVTKEELLDNVWGDRFVTESALTSRIKSARQAVGDNGRDQAVIKTIHGRGYRFIAEATMTDKSGLQADPAPPIERPVTGSAGSGDAPELDDRWPMVGRHDDLENLQAALDDTSRSGVLMTGPAGIGKTRLARMFLDRVRASGAPTAQLSGHAEAEQIPLASLAHLLPDDVLELGSASGDLARAVVFQRARAALDTFAGGQRLVILADNADHIDELSAALLGSLVSSNSVFAILTQRTGSGDQLVLDELVRGGQVVHLPLAPLDDTDLDVLLYRVLNGPIDLHSLQQLTQLAQGRPGALQQLVEGALATNALERQSDVWRLTGTIQASAGHPGPDRLLMSALEPAAHAGAELLAIAEELDLDLATELLGAEVLDTLDRAGLLALSDDGTTPVISLAHPHIRLLLLDSIGPLRARRHKTRLIAATELVSSTDRELHLRRTCWMLETGTPPDQATMLDAARFAVATASGAMADLLLDHLDGAQVGPEARQLRAELCFRRGQISSAETLLESLDPTDLPGQTGATVLRRRATIHFHIRGNYSDAMAVLDDGERIFDGAERDLVSAHRIGLLGFIGQANEIEERVAQLSGDLPRDPQLEVLRGRAHAALVGGRFTKVRDYFDEHQQLAADVAPGAAQAGFEVMMGIRVATETAAGNIAEAGDLIRRHLPIGRRSMLAWLPMAAARSEMMAGRPRAARELINTPLAAVRSQNLIHAEPQMLSLAAQTAARIGLTDQATSQADTACESANELAGQLRWSILLAVEDVRLRLGAQSPTAGILAAADEAALAGARLTEAELLMLVARAGGADNVADRIDAVASDIEGELWTIRPRHVRALAEGDTAGLAQVALDYRALGYAGLADTLEHQGASSG